MNKSELTFSWGHYLHSLEELMSKYGIDPHPSVNLLFVAVFLVVLAFFAGRRYRGGKMVAPSKNIGFSNLVALSVELLYEMVYKNIGPLAKKSFWLLGGFFVFIFSCNIIGLVPGFIPPTEKFSITFTLGILSFLAYNYVGLKSQGVVYLKHFLGPVSYLIPLILVIEIISHLVRPLTLGLRLFGNITGDHFVVGVFSGLFPLILPIPFMMLGIFISLVQAFVFFQLSLVYIAGAKEEAH